MDNFACFSWKIGSHSADNRDYVGRIGWGQQPDYKISASCLRSVQFLDKFQKLKGKKYRVKIPNK